MSTIFYKFCFSNFTRSNKMNKNFVFKFLELKFCFLSLCDTLIGVIMICKSVYEYQNYFLNIRKRFLDFSNSVEWYKNYYTLANKYYILENLLLKSSKSIARFHLLEILVSIRYPVNQQVIAVNKQILFCFTET